MLSEEANKQIEDRIYRQAVLSLFDLLEELCEGAIAVDTDARIVWISEKYIKLLSLDAEENILGRPIEELIPNSLMRRVVETGRPILLDIMDFGEHSLVVTRMPLKDEQGRLIGAVGFVLYDKLDYLKPLVGKYASLRRDISRAQEELVRHRRSKYTFHQVVGSSPEMLEVKRQARCAARQDSTVILIGDTGTGKELLAQAIHAASDRGQGPFVGVNVSAIPEELLEAEFFGAAPGAYTGADRRGRKGKFELAEGGTLFLDEIGDMLMSLQTKLLRALQEREIEPLGSNKLIKLDVRVIAATSCDLKKLMAEGKFRSDLYYRLNVLPLNVPPLRKRKSDLPALCEVLLEQIAIQTGEQPRMLGDSAMRLLDAYDWPGNVRELRNVLERAVALSERNPLEAGDFEQILTQVPATGRDQDRSQVPSIQPLDEQVENLERRAIQEALQITGGKRAPAAKLLGISRAKLYDKLRKYRLLS